MFYDIALHRYILVCFTPQIEDGVVCLHLETALALANICYRGKRPHIPTHHLSRPSRGLQTPEILCYQNSLLQGWYHAPELDSRLEPHAQCSVDYFLVHPSEYLNGRHMGLDIFSLAPQQNFLLDPSPATAALMDMLDTPTFSNHNIRRRFRALPRDLSVLRVPPTVFTSLHRQG